MPVKKILCALSFVSFSVSGAQAPAVSGAFVTTLGNDTIQLERYTRSGDKLEGDIVRRMPRLQILHYVADLSASGFKGISVSARRYGTDATTAPTTSLVALFADSVATLDIMRNGRRDTVASGPRPYRGRAVPAVPGFPVSVGLYDQILMLQGASRADSSVSIGALAEPSTLTVLRRGRDTVAFTNSFSPGWTEFAIVDSKGLIQSLDSRATTVKTMSRRISDLDFDAVAKGWAAYEAAHGPPGQMSRPDTVRATIGAASLEIAYSRPLRRGRAIFGSVVPFNQVWRTGANAATQLTTSADIMIGNTVVPAGKYTLWSLPTATGAKLIINSQTGQWGTDYDAAKDLARLDLVQTILPKPVEQFTFAIVPEGTGGVLKFSWDDREYSIPFRAR